MTLAHSRAAGQGRRTSMVSSPARTAAWAAENGGNRGQSNAGDAWDDLRSSACRLCHGLLRLADEPQGQPAPSV